MRSKRCPGKYAERDVVDTRKLHHPEAFVDPAKHINSEDIARYVYVSVPTLNRLFRKHLSMPSLEYVINHRIAYAM